MSGNPNMQKIGKRKTAPGQKQPDWLFPTTGNVVPNKHQNGGHAKNEQEKELAKELLKRRAAGGLTKSTPPTELVELIGTFLVEHDFTSTNQSFRSERIKRGEHSEAVEGLPSLSRIYNEWRELKGNSAAKEEKPRPEHVKASLPAKPKTVSSSSSESESSEDSEDSEDSDIRMTDAPQVKKASARKSSSSSSSASSSSDSDADDEDDDNRGPVAKPVATKAKVNGLKRKASSSSESSSSSASESSSEDEPPKAKKAKTKAASSSSDDSSESDSGAESYSGSGDQVSVSKKVQANSSSSSSESSSDSDSDSSQEDLKAKKVTTSISSDSGSSSESESDSSNDSDPSTNSIAQKVPLPASDSESSDSDSDSDSDVEGPFPKKPNNINPVSSDTSATLSDAPKKTSDSSSDSSSSGSDSDSKPKATKVTTTVTKTTDRKLSPPLPPAPVIKQSKKTNVPFSRIPKDIKVDGRLASNAYVPYDYAQKAHEDLIVTKGKGFTKEKNKKKRGSYRGGYIDVEGKKGIKFDD